MLVQVSQPPSTSLPARADSPRIYLPARAEKSTGHAKRPSGAFLVWDNEFASGAKIAVDVLPVPFAPHPGSIGSSAP